RLEDAAPVFDPTTVPAPDLSVPPLARKPGGMGVHLMRQCTDTMSHQAHPGGGNILTLVRATWPDWKEAGWDGAHDTGGGGRRARPDHGPRPRRRTRRVELRAPHRGGPRALRPRDAQPARRPGRADVPRQLRAGRAPLDRPDPPRRATGRPRGRLGR